MSLIKCPECGAEISSNAGQCIKCGCKISYCPDCGKVYIGKIETCTACGYTFNKPDKIKMSPIKEQVKQISAIIDTDKKTQKRISIIQKIIDIISGIMLVIGCILYFVWDKSDSIDKLLKIESLYNGLAAITVIGCTCLLASMEMDDLSVSFLVLRRARHIKKMQFDRRAFAESGSSFAANGRDAEYYAASIKQSIFINENPSIKKWFVIPEITHIVFYLLTDICLSVWVIDNLKNLFAARLLDVSYDIQFVSAAFFCAIAFFVLGFVMDILILQNVRDSSFKKWCGKNKF